MTLSDIIEILIAFLAIVFGVSLKVKMDSLKKSAEKSEERAVEAEKETAAVKAESETREKETEIYQEAVEVSRKIEPDPDVQVQMEKIRLQVPRSVIPEKGSTGTVTVEHTETIAQEEEVEASDASPFQDFLAQSAQQLAENSGTDDAGTSEYMLQRVRDRKALYEERYGTQN